MSRSSLLLEDFSGGLDLVSSLSSIEPPYCTNAMNFRLAEGQAGVEKILGYAAFCDLGSGVAAHELYYFQFGSTPTRYLIAASATKLHWIDSAGTATDLITGRTSTAATGATFASYADYLYCLDPVNDGVRWDGAGATDTWAPGVSTGPPRGIILGVWSNRIWVAKASSGSLGTEIVWSDAGLPLSWPAANTVTLGDVGGNGKLIGGIPTPEGLLCFTEFATYLVYDTDGTNRLVDAEHGCSSRKSLALVEDHVYGLNHEGVFRCNGAAPQELVSRRVDPLFTFETPVLSGAAGTWWKNAYLVSYQRTTSPAYNDLTLDVYPSQDSIMANQYRSASWAHGHLAGTDNRLYFVDAGNTRYIRRAFSGGSFLTTASPGVASDISCYYETPPLDLGEESMLKRLHRVRLVGRGDMYVAARVDYSAADVLADRFDFPAVSGGVWNTAVWDTDTWSGYALFEGLAEIPVRGRRIALRFYESSDDTYPNRNVLGLDISSNLGGAGLYLVEPVYSIQGKRRQT